MKISFLTTAIICLISHIISVGPVLGQIANAQTVRNHNIDPYKVRPDGSLIPNVSFYRYSDYLDETKYRIFDYPEARIHWPLHNEVFARKHPYIERMKCNNTETAVFLKSNPDRRISRESLWSIKPRLDEIAAKYCPAELQLWDSIDGAFSIVANWYFDGVYTQNGDVFFGEIPASSDVIRVAYGYMAFHTKKDDPANVNGGYYAHHQGSKLDYFLPVIFGHQAYSDQIQHKYDYYIARGFKEGLTTIDDIREDYEQLPKFNVMVGVVEDWKRRQRWRDEAEAIREYNKKQGEALAALAVIGLLMGGTADTCEDGDIYACGQDLPILAFD